MHPVLTASTAGASEGLQQLVELYGGGPLAALIATLVCACAGLFAILVRSWSSHLRDAREVAALAEKMTTTVEANTRVLERSMETLQDATVLLKEQLRRRGPRSSPSGGGDPDKTPPLGRKVGDAL